MKVSKTGFINLIRCDRFAALEEIERNKENSIVTFSDNMDDLMTAENMLKRKVVLAEIEDEDNIEDDLHFMTMKPYYDKVELLSSRAISNKFMGNLIFNMDTFKQAKYSTHINGYDFYCFLDGLLIKDNSISVFESKSTTTKKYLDMKDGGESIFILDENNILRLKKELGYKMSDKYKNREKRLFDKYTEVGSYVYDLAFQRFVIENSESFIRNKDDKYYLAVLNSEYIFDGKYDLNGEPIYSDDIIVFIDFTQITEKYLEIIEKDVNTVIKRLDQMNAQEVDLGRHCQRKKTNECKFYNVCFKRLTKDTSILNYISGHNGFKDGDVKHELYDLINEGYTDILDVPYNWLNRSNNQIQYNVVKDNEPYYDKQKIKAGINELKYPIYHLDFETFPCPLPRFKGEKAYSQSLFQFSIHIEKEPGVCDKDKDHYSFLASDHSDVREELIKEMLKIIKPDGGSICVYNIAFEKTRIKELGEYYPKYKDRLNDIANRLFDLYNIVRSNTNFYKELGYDEERAKQINFYDISLAGSYSIKKILPIFSNLSYDDLNIKHGEQAYAAYATLPTLTKEEFNDTYNAMIEYCKQDTWSMVKILSELRKIV